ncbi:UDP-glucose dehydrogenase family protein [Mumia zhuanghuii]|uniref:UDP-glucose 6-dehydrogenase n=1 Tax=Mumia zhuanghuii TaxID=2585211 RepID=A0A5C4MQK2_9ACTN|nr:UDP-glucose/GDP-mannose dehydrogenase family protein [Mumia zhuanghuii]TNC42278.1 UDP-glucose/GDP-mannose dehydrogenase family protein [Mumia zhuanghuii]TNC46348.1 UDP-glucose/GDP-mannose dehydrogenase family protein [Mumia zhuanghuii]
MKISVIGTGYLGATHAACLASYGHDVVALDVDESRVRTLAAGHVPFHEPGLDELVVDGLRTGRLRPTSDPAAIGDAEIHFLCVGTPQVPGGRGADLTALDGAAATVARAARQPCLVVGRSTVPVGTADALAARMETEAAVPVSLAWNPEFLREGRAVEDSLRPDRLVLGVADDAAYVTLSAVYAPVVAAGVQVIRTDRRTAELAKTSANVMLASRISVVNVLSEMCERAGADIGDLVRVLGSDPRIGPDVLQPGLGFGGSCLPKDTRAFVAQGRELGVESVALIHEVDMVNMRQRARAIDAVRRAWGSRRRVAVLGAAFKQGSDDVRDSPALDVARTLHHLGATVMVHDPLAAEAARRAAPELGYADDVESAVRDADVVAVLTPWEEYTGLDPVSLYDLAASPSVVDARGCLDADKWTAAGWRFHGLGRSSCAS